jgi:peptidylprolyl isomerase
MLLFLLGCSAISTRTAPVVVASPIPEGPPAVEGRTPIVAKNGLITYILQEGQGASPSQGQLVGIRYQGWLPDGSLFDQSQHNGELFLFRLGIGQVLQGWDQAVAEMKIGEKRLIIVPPALAFGDRVEGTRIPANATINYTLELVSIR